MHSTHRSAQLLRLAATLFLVGGVFGLYRDWQFAGNIQRTTGTVDSGNLSPFTFPGSFRSHRVSYTYTVADRTWHDTASVSGFGSRNPMQIQHLPIKYLPESPNVSRIDYDSEDRKLNFGHWLWLVYSAILYVLGRYGRRSVHMRSPRRSSEF